MTVKFSKQTPEFMAELRTQVKNYFEQNNVSKFGNLSIVAKSLLMLAVYLVPFIAMLLGAIQSPLLIVASWVFMGLGMAGIGMVLMHDANHGSFSENQAVNKLLGQSMLLLGGFTPNWVYQHNTLHHRFTNIDGHDEDIAPIGMLRFSPHAPLHKVHRYQHWYAWFFYSLMTFSWVTIKDFNRFFKYKKDNATLSKKTSYSSLFVVLISSKIVYYLVFVGLPLTMMTVAWYWPIIGFLFMHFAAGFTLGVIFQTAHVMPTTQFPVPDESGSIENDWAIHQLLTTTNFAPRNRVFSWLIGGLNYQVEHHLFPTISHVHYYKLSKLVKDTAHKYNLPYNVQPSFLRAVYNHYLMLRTLGNPTH